MTVVGPLKGFVPDRTKVPAPALVSTTENGTSRSAIHTAASMSASCGGTLASASRKALASVGLSSRYACVKSAQSTRVDCALRAYPYPGRSTRYQEPLIA